MCSGTGRGRSRVKAAGKLDDRFHMRNAMPSSVPARLSSVPLRHVVGVKGEPMEFQDRMLKCVDCGEDFVFTAGEQLFFHDKQFKNLPKRCKACKQKRTPAAQGMPNRFTKQETAAVCSGCGKETILPFRPTQGRPVFCRECFGLQKKTSGASA